MSYLSLRVGHNSLLYYFHSTRSLEYVSRRWVVLGHCMGFWVYMWHDRSPAGQTQAVHGQDKQASEMFFLVVVWGMWRNEGILYYPCSLTAVLSMGRPARRIQPSRAPSIMAPFHFSSPCTQHGWHLTIYYVIGHGHQFTTYRYFNSVFSWDWKKNEKEKKNWTIRKLINKLNHLIYRSVAILDKSINQLFPSWIICIMMIVQDISNYQMPKLFTNLKFHTFNEFYWINLYYYIFKSSVYSNSL